ncbi:hypothetical protein AC1031_001482 [Aphanomyces cochlioides]|nr:hypothetical protein AC1031_001482 [Aphanomyces cochlioides]
MELFMYFDLKWFLGPAIFFAILMPFLFVFATWDHEMFRQYVLLPGPLDWGSKEFVLRCWLSRWVRTGWSSRNKLLAPCPRIAMQTKFTILDSEIANVKASLGTTSEGITSVPLVFPQVICSYLLVQLLGNSHFPCPVHALKWKRLHVTQLRRILVDEQLNCLMVLIDKKLIPEGVEFTVQTDLFDEEGVVWQSSLYFVVPMANVHQVAIPLSQPSNLLDQSLMESTLGSETTSLRLPVSKERLVEFNLGGAADIERFSPWSEAPPRVTPLWMVAAACAAIEKHGKEIAYPLVCHSAVAEDDPVAVSNASPTGELHCDVASKSENESTKLVTFNVSANGKTKLLSGYLRSVGWKYVAPEETDQTTE